MFSMLIASCHDRVWVSAGQDSDPFTELRGHVLASMMISVPKHQILDGQVFFATTGVI